MTQSKTRVLAAAGVALLALPPAAHGEVAAPTASPPAATPLDAYVAAPDPSYGWEIAHQVDQPTHTELIVDLTSQTWRDEREVSRTVWKHWLLIVVPKGVETTTGLLIVAGGSNEDDPPERADERTRDFALATRSVVATVHTVPNQPIALLGSDAPQRERYEDDLLAGSWIECMKSGDPTWIAQLAMAKSAVAAMTAVQEAVATIDGAAPVERFTVAGGSKRGWTTWLAGAVDDRVAAIAPIVIDVLNIAPSMKHHHACYGFWAEALEDYEDHGLADRLDDEQSAAIRAIVDPYVYRDRLTMPKCLINASGDEFFLPDSSRFYFDALRGEKHLSYTPNTAHNVLGSDALDTLVAFHAAVAHDLPRPTVTWQTADDGSERTVRCSSKPIEAVVWRAVNPEARDFRHPEIGDAFVATPLEPEAIGSYRVPITAPEKGFSATFARFTFDIGAPRPFRISTPVWVSPDVEPFAEQD